MQRYADLAPDYSAALTRFSSLVADSLATLGTSRAAELEADAPAALFLQQQWLIERYQAESQGLPAERCQFLASDLGSIADAEFLGEFGRLVSDLVEASRLYRDGIERATQ